MILEHYHGDVAVRAKADASPVTAADEAAEAVILARLAELTPEIPVVAEETVAAGHVPEIDDGPFWLVDPLDGTKEFLSRNGEFTVNIALVEAREPMLGVVLAPARAQAWWGARGRGATARDAGRQDTRDHRAPGRRRAASWRSPAARTVMPRPRPSSTAPASPSASRPAARSSSAWSPKARPTSIPRFGRTMEWDVAAGHAVLAAAGGRVTTRDGAPFLYRKPGFENPPFIARGG